MFTIFFFALFGLYAFAAGIEGYMENKLKPLFRLLTLGAAGALLWPVAWYIHLVGLIVLIGVFVLNRRAPQGEVGATVLAA